MNGSFVILAGVGSRQEIAVPNPNKRATRATAADDLYMTAQQVAARFGISRRSVDIWLSNGQLPEPRRFTKRTVLYLRAEIEAVRPVGSAA